MIYPSAMYKREEHPRPSNVDFFQNDSHGDIDWNVVWPTEHIYNGKYSLCITGLLIRAEIRKPLGLSSLSIMPMLYSVICKKCDFEVRDREL